MFPFWDLAIAPTITAAGAKRIVEIGALRGETTAFMLEKLGPDAELHVIDPVPVFDPTEHEVRFPGRYLFHRALSLDALRDIPAADVALIDGDHNWYTVYNECRLLGEAAEKAGASLPILILHDVLWPYGRRDLYYAPDQIPEEFRQPYAQLGMLPGETELLDHGGLNPTMYNALTEGGPRNGVRTGLDDFLAEFPRPVRRVLLPVYFGLEIVVEQARLDERPELAAVLDGLEAGVGQAELAEMAERVRIDSLVMQHGVFFTSEERIVNGARQYLDLLAGALLNEHYPEQEVRIDHLLMMIDRGARPRSEALRDPGRQLTDEVRKLRDARRNGTGPTDEDGIVDYFPYTTMGRTRIDKLRDLLETVRAEAVEGDLVDCGTGRGGSAIFLRGFLSAFGIDQPTVWVADQFRARPEGVSHEDFTGPEAGETLGGGRGLPHLQSDLNAVREGFDRFGLLDSRVRFVPGDYASTLPNAPIERVAMLRIGTTSGADTTAVLDSLYDKITVGGFVVVDRHDIAEVAEAVEAFRSRRGIEEQVERIDASAVEWRKVSVAPNAAPEIEGTTVVPSGPPLAPPRGWVPTDLTVVVVFYNMKREAARTLHSLSRAYQQGLDDVTYDVVVVDNGSDPDQRLDRKFVRSFGPEFRLIDMGPDAPSSPVPALNEGIRAGRGKSFALMIDGAHVLTPGVLRYGLTGLKAYAPAVVATQQWYVGPGQQGEMVAAGYGQEAEDDLFEAIHWPADGYDLFDISHFIGERDWFDGMWESNCLFVERAQMEQAGCFDERFSIAGGGYANLDIFERLGASPDVNVVSILGEGSFHQVHGGTTTNSEGDLTLHVTLGGYADDYADFHGRGFRGHNKPVQYIGGMRPQAARTKARRRVAPNLFAGPAGKLPGGMPQTSQPLPQDLWAAFTDAYWNTLKWRDTMWLGKKIPKVAGDLFAYQEILEKVRPDWIVETGTGNGGRAWFLATICDLLGHGQVISIDKQLTEGRPEHPRITYIEAITHERPARDAVDAIVGENPNCVVILGSRGASAKMSGEYSVYEDLVPKGSYVIMEDTIVGGHPVWGNFGVGPYEAVKGITETRGDFVSDASFDKYGLTFNPTGYLRRIKPRPE